MLPHVAWAYIEKHLFVWIADDYLEDKDDGLSLVSETVTTDSENNEQKEKGFCKKPKKNQGYY